jgi:putative spermidine/putrescine transport system substrate-binding protein
MKNSGMKRRDFIKWTMGISGMLMAGGVPLTSLAAPKRFTVASTGGSWGDAVRDIFVIQSGFKEQHDLDVQYEFNIDAVVVAKALANKENPVFDVSSAITGMAAKMYVGGALMDPLDRNIITHWDDIYPQATMGDYFVGYMMVNMPLVYNTKYITSPPQSFKELWNPKYKGRVGFSSYKHVGSWFLHAMNKMFGGNEKNVMPGIEAFSELVKEQKAIGYDNTDHAMKLFEREEIWIAPFWDGRARQLQDKGIPVDYVWPPYWLPFTMGFPVLKNTKVPDIAQYFVNETLRPDLQVEFMKKFKYFPSNRRCKIPEEFKNIIVPEAALERAADLDWVVMVKNSEENLELWNKNVLGG